MGHDAYLSLTLALPVPVCSECGGSHDRVHFSPEMGPEPGQTHRGVCPATGQEFWLNTQAVPGVWGRLLRAAGAI